MFYIQRSILAVLAIAPLSAIAAPNTPDVKPAPTEDNRKDHVLDCDVGCGVASFTLKGKYRKLTITGVSGSMFVDASELDVEVLEITDMSGSAKVTLKGVGKKLIIAQMDGSTDCDASEFTVDEVEIGSLSGSPSVSLAKCKGDVKVAKLGGTLSVAECRDFLAKNGACQGEVIYTGEAKLPRGSSRLKLKKKVEPAKQ